MNGGQYLEVRRDRMYFDIICGEEIILHVLALLDACKDESLRFGVRYDKLLTPLIPFVRRTVYLYFTRNIVTMMSKGHVLPPRLNGQ